MKAIVVRAKIQSYLAVAAGAMLTAALRYEGRKEMMRVG
jgi:hypothetical protein